MRGPPISEEKKEIKRREAAGLLRCCDAGLAVGRVSARAAAGWAESTWFGPIGLIFFFSFFVFFCFSFRPLSSQIKYRTICGISCSLIELLFSGLTVS
jgi:hypothetical protein